MIEFEANDAGGVKMTCEFYADPVAISLATAEQMFEELGNAIIVQKAWQIVQRMDGIPWPFNSDHACLLCDLVAEYLRNPNEAKMRLQACDVLIRKAIENYEN